MKTISMPHDDFKGERAFDEFLQKHQTKKKTKAEYWRLPLKEFNQKFENYLTANMITEPNEGNYKVYKSKDGEVSANLTPDGKSIAIRVINGSKEFYNTIEKLVDENRKIKSDLKRYSLIAENYEKEEGDPTEEYYPYLEEIHNTLIDLIKENSSLQKEEQILEKRFFKILAQGLEPFICQDYIIQTELEFHGLSGDVNEDGEIDFKDVYFLGYENNSQILPGGEK